MASAKGVISNDNLGGLVSAHHTGHTTPHHTGHTTPHRTRFNRAPRWCRYLFLILTPPSISYR